MLAEGISLPPSQFEAFFISRAHTREDLEYTVAAADAGLGPLALSPGMPPAPSRRPRALSRLQLPLRTARVTPC